MRTGSISDSSEAEESHGAERFSTVMHLQSLSGLSSFIARPGLWKIPAASHSKMEQWHTEERTWGSNFGVKRETHTDSAYERDMNCMTANGGKVTFKTNRRSERETKSPGASCKNKTK